MDNHFVILELFQHEVSCCCPGQKHQHLLEFQQGDIWTITNERKYVDCLGWHVLIEVNNKIHFLMHVEDVEELYSQRVICSLLDLDLRINHLRFKVNEALDAHDRTAFLSFTDELSNVQRVKSKIRYADVQAL